MNIKIYDYYGSKEYISWSKGQFRGLTFTNEMPGGMVSASFTVPVIYHYPYQWADVYNRVKIYHESDLVWAGYIFGLERAWGDTSAIKVSCVGEVARFATQTTGTNLSNEKASTYIVDHILNPDGNLDDFIDTGEIDTTDYTIPGTLEFKPYKTKRQIMDELYSYNEDTHDWYVWDNDLYWVTKEETISYETSTKFSEGSLRQDLSEFANVIYYSYRDTNGVIQTSSETDTSSAYPNTRKIESYSDNMTAAQAETRAEASLEESKVLGSVANITIRRIWKIGGGEFHVSKIRPGKIIRIRGLVTAKASPAEAFTLNDIDVFRIASVTYDDESQSASITPGRLPQNIVRALE